MCEEGELHVKCDFISRNEPKLCTLCNYATTKTAYLKRHNKLNHEPNSDISKVISCTECEYQTLDPNSANKHNRAQHLGETRFYCDICGFKYFYKQNVKEHIKAIHGDIKARVKSDNCRKCQTNVKHGKCKTSQPSKTHGVEQKNTEMHSTEEQKILAISCKQCKKSESHEQCNAIENEDNSNELANSTILNKCDQCDYSAEKSSTINIHVKIVHSKEVRYSCVSCEYKSFYKKKVTFHNNHVHVNTKQRVIGIECLMCEEGELHVKCEITTNIKSQNEPKETLQLCTHCSYTTTKKEYFKKHKKLNHGTNSDVSKNNCMRSL